MQGDIGMRKDSIFQKAKDEIQGTFSPETFYHTITPFTAKILMTAGTEKKTEIEKELPCK